MNHTHICDGRIGVGIFTIGILFSGFVGAETPVTEEVVVTGTRQEHLLLDLAGNTARLSGDEIELIGHTHINETMSRVPGAWISRGNGQEHLTAIRSPVFTGPGACGAFLMAEDGIPVSASGFCNVNELFELNTEQAGSIELVRGPGSALYGSNAMHGVLNVLSASPADGHDDRISLEAGPHEYYRLKTTASRGDGENGYRFSANFTEDGGWRDASGFAQQKLNYRQDFGSTDHRQKLLLSATNLDQETAGFIAGLDAYKDEDLRTQNFDPEAYRKVRSLRASYVNEFTLSNGDRVAMTPYMRHVAMEFLQHFLPQDPLEENGHNSIGIQTQWIRQLGADHEVISGVDLEYTNGFLKETQELPTGGFGNSFPQGKHYDYEVNAVVFSPYVHAEWTLAENTLLTTGLRAEYTRYDYDNKMIDGNTQEDGTPCPNASNTCRYTRPADRDDEFSNLSPKLGVVYRVDDSHSLYGNLSRGFRAPQTSELYRLQGSQNVADLKSERLDSLELGARGGNGMIEYDVNFYVMRKENVIFQDDNRANISDGKTRHRGVELAFLVKPAEQFDVGLNVSYAHHEYDSSAATTGGNITEGDDIDTAPRWMGALVVGWDFHTNGRAELEWIHMGKYYTDVSNEHSYPGHDLLNLRVSYQTSDRIKLFARIINLSDELYAERADFAFGEDRYFPGEPRSFYAGVELSF